MKKYFMYFVGSWGSLGSTNGLFNAPNGMVINSAGTTVYVEDTTNNRVEYFDPLGNYLGQWGSGGTGNGNFNGPDAVVVNNAGTTIYVGDNNNQRVEYFTAN